MPTESNQPHPLAHDLDRAMRKKGIAGGVEAAWIVATANQVSRRRFLATTFRGGELLCVAVNMSAIELTMAGPQFIEAINKKLGSKQVRSIRFKQG